MPSIIVTWTFISHHTDILQSRLAPQCYVMSLIYFMSLKIENNAGTAFCVCNFDFHPSSQSHTRSPGYFKISAYDGHQAEGDRNYFLLLLRGLSSRLAGACCSPGRLQHTLRMLRNRVLLSRSVSRADKSQFPNSRMCSCHPLLVAVPQSGTVR